MVTPFDGGKQITSAQAFATQLGITQAELVKLTGIDRHALYTRLGLLKLEDAVRH